MLPEHLKAQFWIEVEQMLQRRHRLNKKTARHAVEEYRARVEGPRVGDMVYHRDADEVAATIAAVIDQGGFCAVEPHTEVRLPEAIE